MVQETGKIIEIMVTDIQQLSTLIGEISSASEEQSHGIEQVNEAVSQMDRMTQQNAGLVEEHSAASQRLIVQSHQLRDHVACFSIAASGMRQSTSETLEASPDTEKRQFVAHSSQHEMADA